MKDEEKEMEKQQPQVTTALKITMKELFMKIYIPFLIIGMVYQGGNMLVPLFLKIKFNSTDTFIGFAATVNSIGNLLAAVPVGKSIEKFGTRNTQLSSLILFVVAFVFAGLMEVPGLILISNFIIGVGFCQYHLPQHTFLSGNVPVLMRGKAMAYTGGTHRVAGIFGPLLVALFAAAVGLQATFFCLIPCMIMNFIWQYINFYDNTSKKHLLERTKMLKEEEEKKKNNDTSQKNNNTMKDEPLRMSTSQIMYDFRHVLFRVSIYCILLTFVRYGRVLMIPLFGLALKLSVTEIAVISSASYFSGASMFPVSGYIMDRFGRKKNAFITTFVMAIGFLIMYISTNFGLLLASGILIGFGNGLSSGLVMTLGGDMAPNDKRRGPFLGIYKLLISTGQLIGPIVAGWASDVFGVQGGAISCLIVAILACTWVVLFIPETRNFINSKKQKEDEEKVVVGTTKEIVVLVNEEEGSKD